MGQPRYADTRGFAFHEGERGKECVYKTKKIKQKKCKESGCPFEKVDCTFNSGKDCDSLKKCKKKIVQKSKCVNPQEKGKCKHILRRCDCA